MQNPLDDFDTQIQCEEFYAQPETPELVFTNEPAVTLVVPTLHTVNTDKEKVCK